MLESGLNKTKRNEEFMIKKRNKNPIYTPNSFEKDIGGFIDFGGKSSKEKDKEYVIQKKLALKNK